MPSPQRLTETWGWVVVLGPIIAAFFWAPLAFGGTTPLTLRLLDEFLVLSFVLWLGLLIYEWRVPRVSLPAVVSLLFLIVLGTIHVMNPRSVYTPTFAELEAIEQMVPQLPGSIDSASTMSVLLHFGALTLGGFVLQDALARSKPRWILFRSVALAGLCVALTGIYQKASMADAMLWTTQENSGQNFFAAFRYHANAASFLNLSWPAALAVFLRSRLMRPVGLIASLDLCVFFFVLAAVFVNTSKAGQMIGILGVLIAAWRYRRDLLSQNVSRSVVVVLVCFFLAVFSIVMLPGVVGSMTKWNELAETGGSLRGRLLAYGVCLEMLPESGFFGIGAGTFRHLFPFYTGELGDRIIGFWYHAHQDWLQGIIEWGYAGFAAWVVIFGGSMVRLWRRVRDAAALHQPEITATIPLLALALVLIHGLVDFPLQIPAIQLLVVFYLAVGWSHSHHLHHSKHENDPPAAGSDRSSQRAALSTKH
jgi:O-antigen ligase